MKKYTDYEWDKSCRLALDAARIADRPLLIRGEPGIGKSTLAKYAAEKFDMNFISEVVTARTEPNDLLWQYDAVGRLGDAQGHAAICELMDAVKSASSGADDGSKDNCAQNLPGNVKQCLSKDKYVAPGVLWCAFDHGNAVDQYGVCKGTCSPGIEIHKEKGWVVLIDEIDKAESDVPNSLLEALGEGGFHVPYLEQYVTAKKLKPLVIITTNEERELPPAFLRRCLVLHMAIPEEDPKAEECKAEEWLVARGRVHNKEYSDKLLSEAAKIIIAARQNGQGPHIPGLSEYLDLLKVVHTQLPEFSEEEKPVEAALGCVKDFVIAKNSRF